MVYTVTKIKRRNNREIDGNNSVNNDFDRL